ncbi:MAG: hypothetical protein ACFHWX_09560 [Bacteroidota bacterium]
MIYRFPAYNKSPGVVIGTIILLACYVPFIFGMVPLAWEALVPGLFILFFTFVLVASAFKLMIRYDVIPDGIRIYKPPFHKKLIPYKDIKKLVLHNDEEARQLMEKLMLEQNSFSESMDIVGYISYIKKNTPAYKYFTYAPTVRVTTAGAKEQITSVKVLSKAQFITLILNDESFIFLSPKDPVGFVEQYRTYSNHTE